MVIKWNIRCVLSTSIILPPTMHNLNILVCVHCVRAVVLDISIYLGPAAAAVAVWPRIHERAFGRCPSIRPSAWANQGIIPKIDSLNLFHDPRRHRNGHTATQIIICNGMSVWWARWGMAGPGMGRDGTARTCRRWQAACYRTHRDWEQRCMDIILQIDSHHDLCSAWWPRKSHPHWAGRQAAGPNHNHKYILGTHMDKGGGVYWGHRSMGWGVFAVCIYLLAGHT